MPLFYQFRLGKSDRLLETMCIQVFGVSSLVIAFVPDDQLDCRKMCSEKFVNFAVTMGPRCIGYDNRVISLGMLSRQRNEKWRRNPPHRTDRKIISPARARMNSATIHISKKALN
jgi:hypothetical protein